MICDDIASSLGFGCVPLTEDARVAMILTPFKFTDGEAVPVFIESHQGGLVRFFDDGQMLMHFRGRGLQLDDKRRLRFLTSAAAPFEAVMTAAGELEVWSRRGETQDAFRRYVSAALAIVDWEREQEGLGADLSLFVDEVGLALRAWKPGAPIVEAPEFTGVTGQTYRLDYLFEGKGVVATSLHPISLAASVKKLLDIRSAPRNERLELLSVIDDRPDPAQAGKDGLVLQVVGEVIPFTRLVHLAQVASSARH